MILEFSQMEQFSIFCDSKTINVYYRQFGIKHFSHCKFLIGKIVDNKFHFHNLIGDSAQTYKNDISMEQKQALIELLRKKFHPKITPEIRRELLAGKPRDEVEGAEMDVD